MTHAEWEPMTMAAVDAEPVAENETAWIWNGFLMPGDITLLTSRWKTGKTTLLAGLLRHLETGTPFLERDTRPARAWIVSEESRAQWRERLRRMPIGSHVELIARPFEGRPTPDDWNRMIDRAIAARPGLFVVDPLASFLPGRCESDAASLLEAMQPLLRLTAAGTAVLLLHHPRKKPAEVGSAARGSGAMLGFVDISLELSRAGGLDSETNRRLIRAQSRREGVPARLAYEWDPATGVFSVATDPRERHFQENWPTMLGILKGRTDAITHKEFAEYWPYETDVPGKTVLYAWCALAFDRKLVRREGRGTKSDPYGYRLENKGDRYRDQGRLEPLEPLDD